MFKNKLESPGIIVTAAFIGPGTVTVCTLAGAQYGFQLLWALGLSILITIVFQEMALRVTLNKNMGLSEVISQHIKSPIPRFVVLGLVIIAIVIGNSAYEGGNITGATIGLESLPVFEHRMVSVGLIGSFSFMVLWSGSSQLIKASLTLLVMLMSLAFITSAVFVVFTIDHDSVFTFSVDLFRKDLGMILAIVGTTVVPYNLFLHSSLAIQKWNSPKQLGSARRDLLLSVFFGGVISAAIIITATAFQDEKIENVVDLAGGLESLFGPAAFYLISIGLFAAGLTSAITAPLAAAHVLQDIVGRNRNVFRITWIIVLVSGILFSLLSFTPIQLIKLAQVTNGFLLPLIAGIILWLCNSSKVVGVYRNSTYLNAFATILLCFLLSLIYRLLG